MTNIDRIEAILHYWFGNAERMALPSEHRTWIWFSGDQAIDGEIKQQFQQDYKSAVQGSHDLWRKTPRGSLALIILLDQFSRHIHRHLPQAFEQDKQALEICLQGVEHSYDHQLSLIERVFFYFPLMHSESPEMQALSVRAYQMLAAIAFPETRALFERFLDYAVRHRDLIVQYGRFPHRNEILGRPSTAAELAFLKEGGAHYFE